MWLLFAFGSALFAGATAVLAKCGIRQTPAYAATAIRTTVVLVLAWAMALATGAVREIPSISGRTWLFLVLSGLATGGSWLCYFQALRIGPLAQVTAVDKSSTVLTILLAAVLLGERLTIFRFLAVAAIAAGTLLMLPKGVKAQQKPSAGHGWLWYGVGSALFASLTAILGKIGIAGVNSNLGTALRTCVVLLLAWGMVWRSGQQRAVLGIRGRELGFLCASGLATGGSWLCYYKALQGGPASVVVPVDKLSFLVTLVFSVAVLKEALTRRAWCGAALLTGGTLAMAIF